MITNLDQALKLLKVKGDDEDSFIAINRKAAEDMSAYIGCLHEMLIGVEECTQTVDEFREMLIRLYPDSKTQMKHRVAMGSTISAVAEHIFLTGSGAPEDVARFRYQLTVLNKTGKLSLKEA